MDYQALFGLLLVALGVTLEPLPIVAFILLLSAERGIVKGLGFILGWVACLVVVIGGVIFFLGWEAARAEVATDDGRAYCEVSSGSDFNRGRHSPAAPHRRAS